MPVTNLIALCGLFVIVSYVFTVGVLSLRTPRPLKRDSDKPVCRREYCRAWQTVRCGSGYCGEHCRMHCHTFGGLKKLCDDPVPQRPQSRAEVPKLWN